MQARVKDILFKVATVGVCILAYGMSSRLENAFVRSSCCYEPHGTGYGLAAKTISRSSMWSSDKTKAIQALLSNAPDGYYQSVIAVVNSSMWSSDKVAAIQKESAKFANIIEI